MGAFLKAVQSEEVTGPLRRGFKVKVWTEEHERLSNDAADVSLYNTGLRINEKADAIRSSLRLTFSAANNATTKLRALVAVANYNLVMLQHQTREAVKTAVAGSDVAMGPELASIKLKLKIGTEFSPNEITQSMVDGTQVPIKVLLESEPNLSGNAGFSDVNWDHVIGDFNLGGLYAHVEDLWDDCLWNDYRTRQLEPGLVFEPEDPIWQYRMVASRCRQDNLTHNFFGMARTLLARMDAATLNARIGVRDVKGLVREGRKQVIQLAGRDKLTDEAISLMAARAYASEPYYNDLLHEPRGGIGEATLNDLLSAWSVVSRTAAIMREELVGLEFSEDAKPTVWLPKFVPVLQNDALVRAVSSAAVLPFQQAKRIVEFLTFRGLKGQELWAQPLVPVSKGAVAPMFAAITSPNLSRIVDVWMRQLGVDLGLRGPAFEDHVRLTLRQYIESSPMLNGASVLGKSLVFRPPEVREEEIDVVLVVGDLVIIGEAKCILHPAESKQNAMHRRTVTDAVDQVKRKAVSVERHADSFRACLKNLGVDLPKVFRVLPVVVLNGAIHAGFEVDGVPIVDMVILSVFFEGELVEVATQNKNLEIQELKKRVLYTDADHAAAYARQYFAAPPQLEFVLKGMNLRWVPVPSVRDDDWVGNYLTFDCTPQVRQFAEEAMAAVDIATRTTSASG